MSAGPLSHTRRWNLDVVQAMAEPGVVDLAPGYLDPDLLPVDLLRAGYSRALVEFGSAALSYGAMPGALALREAVAARISVADGIGCGAEQIVVTAGTSHALYVLAASTTKPGQVVFVDRTSYDFGRQILTDHGLRLREVPGDGRGMDPEALARAIRAEPDPAFVYLTPTFHNPTGRLVGAVRRRELLAVTGAAGVRVVEDDAYADLHLDDQRLPPSMAGLAGYRGVIRLGTFSKTIAPGLRLGWLAADPDTARWVADRGVFVSGGSANHVTSLAVAELVRNGDYERHLKWLRDRLRDRRDALVGAVLAGFGDAVRVDRPGGGFFLWPTFTRHTEPELLEAAARARVQVAAGSRFGTADGALRLSFSFNPPERLAAAVTAWAAELG
ncbi:PLP-dependent aminotransferase family protein [Actinosynnema sp. NPDC020468]|uniref:aminotransferase-like domain-containing protein n=1 Tax=Actinosynnema sp. NPDC020468 TaxID=3154488 RepID=UPI0033EA4ABA